MEALDAVLTKFHPTYHKDMKILDVGAGTGVLGEYLKEHGYTNVDALDVSEGMLAIAEKKNVYKKLICGSQEENDVKTGEYDAVLSSGAFAVELIKPEGLCEVARQVKPGKVGS